MTYIIMAGGVYYYNKWLTKILDETVIEHTIRLLQEHGVRDIAISTTHDDLFADLGVPLIHHNNPFDTADPLTRWVDAFCLSADPVCYLFGDVYYSTAAIKKIVEYQTDSVMFFASAPPFAPEYIKLHAEPFAFKVADPKRFNDAVRFVKDNAGRGIYNREPISWEVWQAVCGSRPNEIIYNYEPVNDYTCDIDGEEDARRLEEVLHGANTKSNTN